MPLKCLLRVLGNRYLYFFRKLIIILRLPYKSLVTGLKVAIDKIGVRMLNILISDNAETKLFEKSPGGLKL